MEDNNVNNVSNPNAPIYYSNKFLYKYQVIEEDVGSDGIVIWFIESYVVTDSNGSLWLEEIESNKNCILNNNITRIIPLVTLKERND